MIDPINPPENPVNQSPQDDGMLEALEKSIVKSDPIQHLLDAGQMDRTARMLGYLEANIEGRPPWEPPILPLPADIPTEVPAVPMNPPPVPTPHAAPDISATPTGPVGPKPIGSLPRSGRRSGAGRPRAGRAGSRMSGGSPYRYCMDLHDLVTPETCLFCPKYRHWPEATEEEPRMCWHLWQILQHAPESETEPDSGPETE